MRAIRRWRSCGGEALQRPTVAAMFRLGSKTAPWGEVDCDGCSLLLGDPLRHRGTPLNPDPETSPQAGLCSTHRWTRNPTPGLGRSSGAIRSSSKSKRRWTPSGRGSAGLHRHRGRGRHRQDPSVDRAAHTRGRARRGRPPGRGRGIRARHAVQRLGRRARRLCRVAATSSCTRRGTTSWPQSSAQVLPSLAGAGARGAIADERYKAHRAVRTLLGVIADEQPLVLLLDDLHWSDAASVEMIAALLGARTGRAGADGARVPAAARRPSGCAAAVAGQGVERLRLERADRGRGRRTARRGRGGGGRSDLSPRGRQPVLPRAARPRLERAARAAAGGQRRHGPRACRRRWLRRSPTELASLGAQSRALPRRRGRRGRAVRARPRSRRSRAVREPTASTRSTTCSRLDLVRPTEVPRRFTFRHPLVRARRLRRRPAVAGSWLRTHARRTTLAAHGAGAAERAHHVEQSASQGDEEAIEVLLEAGRTAASRAPAAAVRWFDAALRLLPASDSGAADRGPPRAGLRTARRSANWSAAGRRCSTRLRCCRPTPSRAASS